VDKFKQFLKNISPITDNEFANTILYFTEQNLKKGDFFVKQDKVCRHIAFIIKGTLRTYYINAKAEEITSCFCTENNLTTSYKSFILQQPSNLILQAIEDTQLLVIDYENLQKLYSKSIVWQTIGRAVAEREYIVMEQYASVLNNETAKEKYLRLLNEQPTVLQKANIEDIASYLGVTRRTLSRIRQEISTSHRNKSI
jgi:CRP-like cAMP-binding protein